MSYMLYYYTKADKQKFEHVGIMSDIDLVLVTMLCHISCYFNTLCFTLKMVQEQVLNFFIRLTFNRVKCLLVCVIFNFHSRISALKPNFYTLSFSSYIPQKGNPQLFKAVGRFCRNSEVFPFVAWLRFVLLVVLYSSELNFPRDRQSLCRAG